MNRREIKLEAETGRERGVLLLPNEIGAAAGVLRKSFCITLVHLKLNPNCGYDELEVRVKKFCALGLAVEMVLAEKRNRG